ncbi:MAG: hypothetical protein D6828_04240 [Nitrospirae bacterium]|nr:MAG: hypothetical protein D6828_04240 [Nitrospirota bacterium]
MDWGKVFSSFFIIMALTTSIGFIYDPTKYEIIMAASLNLIATTLKLGTRGILGAEILATSLAADLHLLPAIYVFFVTGNIRTAQGLALGAVVANIVSIIFVAIDTIKSEEE